MSEFGAILGRCERVCRVYPGKRMVGCLMIKRDKVILVLYPASNG